MVAYPVYRAPYSISTLSSGYTNDIRNNHPTLYYGPAFARCKLSMRCSFCSAFVENWCIWSQQLLIWLFSRQPSSGLGSGMGLNRAGSSSGSSSSPAALQVATPWFQYPGRGTAAAAVGRAERGQWMAAGQATHRLCAFSCLRFWTHCAC